MRLSVDSRFCKRNSWDEIKVVFTSGKRVGRRGSWGSDKFPLSQLDINWLMNYWRAPFYILFPITKTLNSEKFRRYSTTTLKLTLRLTTIWVRFNIYVCAKHLVSLVVSEAKVNTREVKRWNAVNLGKFALQR